MVGDNPLQILNRSHFIAGAESGKLKDKLLVNVRAIYGLRTSGALWYDRFADSLFNVV